MPSFSINFANLKTTSWFFGCLLLILLVSASGVSAEAGAYDEIKKGTINKQNPGDRWTFEGTKGWTLIIDLSRTSGDLDPMVWLLNDNGVELASNDDYAGTLNSHLSYSLPYTGEYSVVVGSSGGSDVNSSGSYKLNVAHVLYFQQSAGLATTFYVSSSSSGTAEGVSYRNEDIIEFDAFSGTWSMYFDGSDVGLADTDINALAVISDPFANWNDHLILLSLRKAYSVPGLGQVDDSDILLFRPTRLGTSTAGSFSLLLDGSDIGLTKNSEDIDALSFTQDDDGRIWLVVSTKGSFNVNGVKGNRQDLLIFDPVKTGPNSKGRWKTYFYGASNNLSSGAATENITGLTIADTNSAGGRDFNYLSTAGDYSVANLRGDGNDIFTCRPDGRTFDRDCRYDSEKILTGSNEGLADGYVDAFHIVLP